MQGVGYGTRTSGFRARRVGGKVRAVETDLCTTAAQVGKLDVTATTAADESKGWEWAQRGGYTAQYP